MCTALWQRKRAQRCGSAGADSNVTALGHRWLWHRCDSDVYISVTAMVTDTAVTVVTTDSAVWQRWQCCDSGDNRQCCVTAVKTDSAVTAVAADSAVTAMCTLVWQRCQLPLLSQWCAHRCHTNVHISVTLMWTSLSQRCQLPPLSRGTLRN